MILEYCTTPVVTVVVVWIVVVTVSRWIVVAVVVIVAPAKDPVVGWVGLSAYPYFVINNLSSKFFTFAIFIYPICPVKYL